MFLLTSCALTQGDAPGRIPEYPVAYEYPTVDGIKEVLNRVRTYYESTSPQKIIDSKTGEEITDFSKIDKNSQVTRGFSSEWSYTHGVVLSAFDYIDDVVEDPAFFANNTKFYDLVVQTLPHFIKNRKKFDRRKNNGWGRTPDFHALDDCGSIGAAMIKTYLKNKNEDYLEIINITADYISNKQFRLEDGTLARNRPP